MSHVYCNLQVVKLYRSKQVLWFVPLVLWFVSSCLCTFRVRLASAPSHKRTASFAARRNGRTITSTGDEPNAWARSNRSGAFSGLSAWCAGRRGCIANYCEWYNHRSWSAIAWGWNPANYGGCVLGAIDFHSWSSAIPSAATRSC